MEEEIEALHKNNTWNLVKLFKKRKVIGCRRVFKFKKDVNNNVESNIARLCLKITSMEPVVCMEIIHIILNMAFVFDLRLEQLDMKITFFA